MSVETVLITGASSGIGLELARCFAADGSRLVLLSRKGAALEELATELRKAHKIQAQVITADLALPDAPNRLLAHLQAAGLKVDVLVNNAGIGAQGRFAELPLGRQLEMLQVNITSLTHLTRLLLPGMIERRRGGILNVASTASFQPGPGMGVYYATKAYVLSFTEALAEELSGTGITVTAVVPRPDGHQLRRCRQHAYARHGEEGLHDGGLGSPDRAPGFPPGQGGFHHRRAQQVPRLPRSLLPPRHGAQGHQAAEQRDLAVCLRSATPALADYRLTATPLKNV